MEAYNDSKMCPLNRMVGQVKYRDGAHLLNGGASDLIKALPLSAPTLT